jgi:hypothetical protein
MPNGNSFGGDKQYGKFTETLRLAEDASRTRPNPNC